MVDQELLNRIRNEISEGNLKIAFDLLLNSSDKKSDYLDDIISLKRQFNILENNRAKATINEDSYRKNLNRVNSNFLSLLREIEASFNESTFDNFSNIEDEDFKKLILDYISKGDLDDAFEFLKNWMQTREIPEQEYEDDLLILISQYNSIRKNERSGVLSVEDTRFEYARLSKRLINLINAISNAPQKRIQQKEKQEQIEVSAASFVQESISELSKREQRLKFQAMLWYFIGFISLVGGIVVAVFLVVTNEAELQSTIGIIYLILKSLLIIGLLVAASRYAFNLGKTYMNESLKNADRIHAISFGKFYLQVFGTNIKPDDLKEVFKDWNTSQESPFLKLDSSEFDPQLLQAFLKFAEVMKVNK